MKPIIKYQIEVAICMAAFALFYLIFWRKETNFFLKRIILLGIPLFSIIIPLINVNIDFGPKPESNTIQYITYIPNQLEMVYAPIVAEVETLSGWEIAFWLMSIGICIMIVRLLISYLKIIQIYNRSAADISGEFRIIDDPIQSFSFFNMIVINKSQAKSGARDYILAHEKAHKRQGHSWDILWLEIIKMLHWFNPVIWLLTQESKKNLEYLADQEVATTTGNLKNYQFAIVEHASQTGYQLLKTQFSKNNLKNRIIMMNQPNNYRFASWKLLAIMPLLAILLMSFSLKIENLDIKKELAEVLPSLEQAKEIIHETPIPNSGDIIEVTQSNINSQKNQVDDQIYGIVDEYPKPVGMDRDTYIDKMSEMIKYPQAALQNNVSGKVFVQFVVEKNGSLSNVRTVKKIGYGCDEAVEEAFRKGPRWVPGKQDGEEVRVRTIMPVNFINTDKELVSIQIDQKDSIYSIVDQPPQPVNGMPNFYKIIDYNLRFPEKAKSRGVNGKVFIEIVVLKDGSLDNIKVIKGIDQECDNEAIRLVKEGPEWIPGKDKGRPVNTRITIPITFNPDYNPRSSAVVGRVNDLNGYPIPGCNVIINGTTTGTVTDQNGQFRLELTPSTEAQEITFSSKGYLSQSRFVHNGSVHVIVLKKTDTVSVQEFNEKLFNIKIRDKDNVSTPIYIVNGIEVDNLKNVNLINIESIEVLKDSFAKDKYGEKAKNGVIIIKTNKSGDQGSIKQKNQTGRKLLGKVLDTKGEPIENAFVNIKGSSHVNTNEYGQFELYHAKTQLPRIQAFKEGYLWTEMEITSYQNQVIVLPDFPIEKIKNVIDENGKQSIKSNSGLKIQQYDIVISGEKVFARVPEFSGNFEKFGQELGIQSIPDSTAVRLFGDNARGGVNLRIMR